MLNITITGNLTADPELRFTPAGTPVAAVRVAHNPRRQDAGGQWVDGEATYLRCEIWNGARNVAESLSKGDQVIITGRLRSETYTPAKGEGGQKRTVQKVTVDAIGPSLRWATAKPVKAQRPSDSAEDSDGAAEDDSE